MSTVDVNWLSTIDQKRKFLWHPLLTSNWHKLLISNWCHTLVSIFFQPKGFWKVVFSKVFFPWSFSRHILDIILTALWYLLFVISTMSKSGLVLVHDTCINRSYLRQIRSCITPDHQVLLSCKQERISIRFCNISLYFYVLVAQGLRYSLDIYWYW